MSGMTLKLGLIGTAVACTLWLGMAAFLTAFPTDGNAPPFTTGDMALGTLVSILLFGGVGAAFGLIEDRERRHHRRQS